MYGGKSYTEGQEQLARFAKAMGHPARIAILHFLAKQKCCFFGDIHEVLPISKATVSQHLKELKEAGLIQGTIEPPKVRYCINRENWEMARLLFADFYRDCAPKKKRAIPRSEARIYEFIFMQVFRLPSVCTPSFVLRYNTKYFCRKCS